MTKLVAKLNKSRYFRFFASVQLAVPLMLVLLCVVAAATIVESRYNSEFARLVVYDTWWFEGLLILLGLNIFLAAVSRYPFKQRHLGFVTVHLGLITVLIGGAITKHGGVDGQLRVVEKSRDNVVVLDRLSLDLIDVQADMAIRAPFARRAARLTASDLDFLNERFNSKIIAREFLPFAAVREGYESSVDGAISPNFALGFVLESQFFNVSEWLHSSDRPELQMGTATLRLVTTKQSPPPAVIKKLAPAPSPHKKGTLLVVDESTKAELAQIPIERLIPGFKLPKGLILASVKLYSHAVVVQNRLAEGDQPGSNPAIELQIQSGEKLTREVSYAKFPGFSLAASKGTPLGIKFEYRASGATAETTEPKDQNKDQNSNSRTGNVIEFHVSEKTGEVVETKLFKNDQQVGGSTLRPGESLTTPWMGMKITINSLKRGAVRKTEVLPSALKPRSELPPSAVFVSTAGSTPDQGFWLAEGQFRQVTILGREYQVYFGRETLHLPFALELLEFKKVDYLGTETPMSYESRVRIDGREPEHVVSMNEPLKHAGFTLYQSSYEMRPGAPSMSVFSVNRDPGRVIKYTGSLILSLGIIIFTLMRSRLYKTYFGKPS